MKKIEFKKNETNGKKYLTYELPDDSVLDEDTLDLCEEGALASALSMEYVDDEDSFFFDISNQVSLEEICQGKVNARKLLPILHSMAEAFVDIKENTIPWSYLVLHKAFVYVDPETYATKFICVPLENEDNNPAEVLSFLRAFLANLRYDTKENTSYVACLLSCINDKEHFSSKHLLEEVQRLMEMYQIHTNQESQTNVIADFVEIEDQEEELVFKKVAETAAETEEYRTQEDFEELDSILPKHPAQEDDFEELDSILPKKPSEDEEYDDFLDEEEEEYLDLEDKLERGMLKINRVQLMQSAAASGASDNEAEAESSKKPEKKKAKKESQGSEEKGGNSILKQLNNMIDGTPLTPKACPCLIRTNTEERIMIGKQTFKIGSAKMGVDYTISGNKAVSRSHATIYAKGGEYYIKDNKSTNHTYVNGKIVEANIGQLLEHDSVILLGDEEFVFKY